MLIADIDRAVIDVTAVVVRINRIDSPANEIIDKQTIKDINQRYYAVY